MDKNKVVEALNIHCAMHHVADESKAAFIEYMDRYQPFDMPTLHRGHHNGKNIRAVWQYPGGYVSAVEFISKTKVVVDIKYRTKNGIGSFYGILTHPEAVEMTGDLLFQHIQHLEGEALAEWEKIEKSRGLPQKV